MEHLMACSFADYLCKRQIIRQDYYEVYVYGTELVLSFIITTALVLIAGFVIGEVMNSMIFLAVFMLLRRFTGGYHANTYLKCKIISISTFLIALFSSHAISVRWWMYAVLLVGGNIVIHLLAPVEHPNKPLSDDEKRKFRRFSHVVFSWITISGLSVQLLTPLSFDILFFSLLSVIILMTIPNSVKGVVSDEKKSCKKNG